MLNPQLSAVSSQRMTPGVAGQSCVFFQPPVRVMRAPMFLDRIRLSVNL
jgi:hypothetical protein